jgi:hypothetical protein
MADYPTGGVCPPVLSVFSQYCTASNLAFYSNAVSNGSSGTWPSANRGLFIPIWLPAPFQLASFFCVNGSAVAGNIDMGVYGTDGSLISSKGSTAQSGTSTLQILTLTTPIVLNPGRYFMAISASSASATFISRTPSVIIEQRLGMLQAATQVPLANLPTLATCASAYLPHFGISQLTTY